MEFPFGKAPLAILILAIGSGTALVCASRWSEREQRRPDLIFATFAKEHAIAYQPAIAAFEKENGVKVQIQVVSQRALQGRLQSAMQVGAEVPDMVELLYGTMGIFTRGPVEDVEFVDLNERLSTSRLRDRLVSTRFGLWSSRGHTFALPHDVHPVMLAYRRDLVEKLGIDVSKLTTWDEFCRVGRELVTKDLNGDGINDRYMLDLPGDGNDTLRLLMLQHGGRLFDSAGHATFDSEATLDVVCWYVRQIQGKNRIAFPCGWGQTLSQAMIDGLCLFYICPDWRVGQIRNDISKLSGQMAVMPLPAWEPGGRRTSTWGGAGLAFPRHGRNFELAWKLAMYLYYDPSQLGDRFLGTNILPPLKEAWALPAFDTPDPFFSNQHLGRLYAELAPQAPEDTSSPYYTHAVGKLSEAFTNASLYYAHDGESGLRDYARGELKRCADQVRERIQRNIFLRDDSGGGAS